MLNAFFVLCKFNWVSTGGMVIPNQPTKFNAKIRVIKLYQTDTREHACTRVCTYGHMHAHAHARVHARAHARRYVCRDYTHPPTHACMHVHITHGRTHAENTSINLYLRLTYELYYDDQIRETGSGGQVCRIPAKTDD